MWSGLELGISLLPHRMLGLTGWDISLLLGQLGSDKTPAGEALVNQFLLRTGFLKTSFGYLLLAKSFFFFLIQNTCVFGSKMSSL